MTQNDQDFERVKKAATDLAEHFDSVQIIVTRHGTEESNENTTVVSSGKGNWFARYGSVREWLTKEDARTTRQVMEEEDGD